MAAPLLLLGGGLAALLVATMFGDKKQTPPPAGGGAYPPPPDPGYPVPDYPPPSPDYPSAPPAPPSAPAGGGGKLDTPRMDAARDLAPVVVRDLAKGLRGYNRGLLREFQRIAGLTTDGLYGPRTRGALKFYLPEMEPPAPFTGTGTVPYSPPLA